MVSTGLREFIAVVENGGFTAAANALDVSTSFVSRQVMRLEDRLDTRLLHRTTRAVRLTDMGRIYYERSREILDHLAVLESDMADLQEQPKGRVRITAPGYYAEHFVAPVLVEFSAKYPDVTIELDTSMHLVDLVADGYDLAVRMSPPTDSSLVARKVAPRRMIVCASPAYLAKHGTPKDPEDLREHNCLSLPEMHWRFLYPDRIRNVNEISRGELDPVLEKFEVQDAATWIVYADRHHMPTRVRLLIDFLVEQLRAMDEQSIKVLQK